MIKNEDIELANIAWESIDVSTKSGQQRSEPLSTTVNFYLFSKFSCKIELGGYFTAEKAKEAIIDELNEQISKR